MKPLFNTLKVSYTFEFEKILIWITLIRTVTHQMKKCQVNQFDFIYDYVFPMKYCKLHVQSKVKEGIC